MTIKDPKETTVSINIKVENLDEITAKVELIKGVLEHVNELMEEINATTFKASSENGVNVIVEKPELGGDADA